MNLHHAYHLYADGNWHQGWKEHIKALSRGLKNRLTTFSVGLVGNQHNRSIAHDIVAREGATVVVEVDTGFEQETLDWVDKFVDTNEGYMLYNHSKGAGFPVEISNAWRRTMTYDTVIEWETCVGYLNAGYDAVGTCWHPAGTEFGDTPYFAGNFWWASNTFLRTLPPPLRAHRYGAEGWLGSGGFVNAKPLREGSFPPPNLSEDWINL